MISACYFDKGEFASLQQDALVLEIAALGKREAALLVVCDGIGGLQEGEYAAGYVTMRIRDWFYRKFLRQVRRRYGRRRMEKSCVGMLYDCCRHLQLYGREKQIRLGTTMTMVLLQNRRFGRSLSGSFSVCRQAEYLLFHVGDSRAYRFGRECGRLTADDCLVGNVLHRCIGSFRWQGVQKRRGSLRRGETLMVCSDGFWKRLEEQELQECLGFPYGRRRPRGKMTEEQLERRLWKLGKAGRERGEQDNQAAVALRVD